MMLRSRIWVLLLICLAGQVKAEESFESYWVLGSFASEENARQARSRLQPEIGDTLRIARFMRDGKPWFRVVLAKYGDTTGQKRQLAVLGVQAWTANIADTQLVDEGFADSEIGRAHV